MKQTRLIYSILPVPMLLSVLIPTLESRRDKFSALLHQLEQQIARSEWRELVEVLPFCDKGEHSVGLKRNCLVEAATGRFVVFVDDDDEVNGGYIAAICGALTSRPDLDCIGIRGRITFRGGHPRTFVHSLQYKDYFSRGGTYYRPPYHLNPIRRSIASRYRFADVSYSEDIDWALRLRDDGALRQEEFIDRELYHYRSRRSWTYQWLLDRTEAMRHRLGLRLANRLRLGRPRA